MDTFGITTPPREVRVASRIENDLHTYVDRSLVLIIEPSVHYDREAPISTVHTLHCIFAYCLDLLFGLRIYGKFTGVGLIVTPDGLQPLTQTVSQVFHDMINQVTVRPFWSSNSRFNNLVSQSPAWTLRFWASLWSSASRTAVVACIPSPLGAGSNIWDLSCLFHAAIKKFGYQICKRVFVTVGK